MSALLLALALAAPAAPAPLPRPAPPPITRADLAGRYSAKWRGWPISFTLTADGHFSGFYFGDWWEGIYSLRGGVVYVQERPSADRAFVLTWWFRPVRDRNREIRRHGYACEVGTPPGKKAD